ncbi:hypothetical protein DPMN_070019 [Dreissena polymorpha]|uniref:Uncharacterized protein n=1 Tax=Dreissena polymorpha TaxID=45954 RepID=A0A9D3Z083_DREPO|nr:hypothetical protein DPMN_070019 [Dreissena polymorpha]
MDGKHAFLLSSIACVLNTIGLAIPYWINASKSGAGQSFTVNMGLWSVCVHVHLLGVTVDKCFAYDDPKFFKTTCVREYLKSYFYSVKPCKVQLGYPACVRLIESLLNQCQEKENTCVLGEIKTLVDW